MPNIIDIPLSSSGRLARDVAVQAARDAGDILRRRFFQAKQVTFKGRANVVTDADLESERSIKALLGREYPGFGMLAEESAPVSTGSEFRWIVDPLDGSRNYASGVPHFAPSIALANGDDVVLAVTYDPMRDELFCAQKGKGAFLNDQRVLVSTKDDLPLCLLGFDMGYSDEKAFYALELVKHLWPGVQSIRVMGSAALGLAYAAAGRIDVYFHHHLAPWDIAAGLLLVHEAGGVVTDRKNNPASLHSDSAIATSATLHRRFLEATDSLAWRRY